MAAPPYTNKARVDTDLQKLRTHFQSLTPKTDSYFSESGTEAILYCLVGTVPIMYKGNRYAIPVTIWIPLNYPYEAPFVYVTPTKDMAIKPRHQVVDPNGRCSLEYISMWNASANDMLGLANMLSQAFSVDPPVYAVKQPTAQPAQPPVAATALKNPYSYGATTSSANPEPPPAYTRQSAQDINVLKQKLTEKVQNRLKEFNKEADLKKNTDNLANTEKEMITYQSDVDKATEALALQDSVLETWLADRLDKEFDPASALTSVDPYAIQLVDTVAEEAALEDAIYQLDSALQKNVIDMETFLSSTRTTARDQFFKRALINKILRELGR